MDDIELRVNSLKHISSTHRHLLSQRISQEWKVIVLTLTFFVIVAGGTKHNIILDERYQVFIAVGLTALTACMFLFFLHQSNCVNKAISEAAENALSDYAETGVLSYMTPPNLKKKGDSIINKKINPRNGIALFWQCAIIASFAWMSASVATM